MLPNWVFAVEWATGIEPALPALGSKRRPFRPLPQDQPGAYTDLRLRPRARRPTHQPLGLARPGVRPAEKVGQANQRNVTPAAHALCRSSFRNCSCGPPSPDLATDPPYAASSWSAASRWGGPRHTHVRIFQPPRHRPLVVIGRLGALANPGRERRRMDPVRARRYALPAVAAGSRWLLLSLLLSAVGPVPRLRGLPGAGTASPGWISLR